MTMVEKKAKVLSVFHRCLLIISRATKTVSMKPQSIITPIDKLCYYGALAFALVPAIVLTIMIASMLT